jgi:lipoyl-dependent peroxiredoxin
MMTISTARAQWNGNLKEGTGAVSGTSGHFDAAFTYATRFEGKEGGTTPEELIGAALAGCFSMFLAAQLGKEGLTPKLIQTTAKVHLGAGPLISKIELHTMADVPGADSEIFHAKVAFSKENCPVSKALASVPEIVVNASLG